MSRLNILPCSDSEAMAVAREKELHLSRDRAIYESRITVAAVENGFYKNFAKQSVDWSRTVVDACVAKRSIPPWLELPVVGEPQFDGTGVQVANETTFAAARRLREDGHTTLSLNLANGFQPSGGFLHGAAAQEESLCRMSALYWTLLGDPMYLHHAYRDTADSTDWAILSPGVPFFRDDSIKHFSTGVLVMIVALGLLAIFAWQGISPPKTGDNSVDGVKQAVVAQPTEKQWPEDKVARIDDKPAPAEDKPALKDKAALKDKLAPDVSDSDASPVWGEAVDGLQLAVSGIREDRHFKSGETIRFRLSVRNVGSEAIRFQYKPPQMCDWVAPLVETAKGERVKIQQMFFRGGHKHFSETLEPKAEVSIHLSGILVLGASDTAEKTWPRIEKPEPGGYKLRGIYMLQRLDAAGTEIIERDAAGKRTVKTSLLHSGTVTFHIDE